MSLVYSLPEMYNNHPLNQFYDGVMMLAVSVMSVVFVSMFMIPRNKFTYRYYQNHSLEFWWTTLPILILAVVCFFSVRLLYLLDDINHPQLTLKVIGHQWYWSYEYGDFENLKFDSYMMPSWELKLGDLRLLDVDNRVVLPMKTQIRVLVTSADVIHSWSLPQLAVKVDGLPGRLNQVPVFSKVAGVMYGQCSEICGANHSFMPIVAEFMPWSWFKQWINLHIED